MHFFHGVSFGSEKRQGCISDVALTGWSLYG